MTEKIELFGDYKVVFQTPDDGYSYFFGYYDKSPLNKQNKKLLAHRVAFDGRDVKDGDIAEIGFLDISTGKFIKIDETLAWNWQQGSQLQWLPPDYECRIIYNNIHNGKFVSIIYNLETGQKKIIGFPIYVVHPGGHEALAVNYERHYWCRPGYNYQNIKNSKWDKPYHHEDGIYKVDLITGDVRLIVPITDIVNHKKLPEFDICNNWLEHMMYNPSGKRFMFFHRWHKDGIDHTRLFTADSATGEQVFMFPDSRFYSHAYWKTDDELTIWSIEPSTETHGNDVIKNAIAQVRRKQYILWALRPLYRTIKKVLPHKIVQKISPGSNLLTYHDKTSSYVIVSDSLKGNGHISWAMDKKRFLNDTYQDEDYKRWLMVFDTEINKRRMIGCFFSQYNDCGYRADLHPRFSLDEKFIIIDTAHCEMRKIMVLSGVAI